MEKSIGGDQRANQDTETTGGTKPQGGRHSAPENTRTEAGGSGRQLAAEAGGKESKVDLGLSVLVCSVDGCNSDKIKAKGMCEKHYRKASRDAHKASGEHEPDPVEIRLPGRDAKDVVNTERPKQQQRTNKKMTGAVAKKKTTDIMAGLMETTTMLVSRRVGDHWSFSNEECQAISAPIVSLMDKYDLLAIVEEKSDWVALIMALGTAVIPRVMIGQMVKKQQEPKGELKIVETRTGTGNSGNHPDGTNTNASSMGETNVADILNSIPSF